MNLENVRIAPSILAADFDRLAEQIAEAEAGGADWIHIDVMDGHFVPNLTMGPVVVEACRKATSLPLDVHLMIEEPERLIAAFSAAGADLLTVNIEACPHIHRTIQQIRSENCRAGVALNPGTPLTAVEPILDQVDLVLAMTVNPGFGGQSFIPQVLEKVNRFSAQIERRALSVQIEVDGGISESTIGRCFEAGARVFVAGSAVFKHPGGIKTGMEALRNGLSGQGAEGRASAHPSGHE